jgi:hypothetical protein
MNLFQILLNKKLCLAHFKSKVQFEVYVEKTLRKEINH